MSENNLEPGKTASVLACRDHMLLLRERILADAVMIGEIPAPTFGEDQLVKFLCDRFTEEGLDRVAIDEVKNASAVLPGRTGKKNILVAAHTDKIWHNSIDHTISVTADSLVGPGIADNALGVTTLTMLPAILNLLGLQLDANLILLGASRSMGHGDLEGLSFFVDNVSMPIGAGLCLEGVQQGRLSYSSLGMNRCEIRVTTEELQHWDAWSRSGAIIGINRIVHKILSIRTPEVPKTSIILGSITAGTSFNVPPTHGSLKFEVRSEEPGMVTHIREQIEELVAEVIAEHRINAELEIIAQRKPGSIEFSHPLVRSARSIMKELGIEPLVAPSISELSVLLDRGIPSLTLGITKGDKKHQLEESIQIAPIFTGLAQVVAVLQFIDEYLENE